MFRGGREIVWGSFAPWSLSFLLDTSGGKWWENPPNDSPNESPKDGGKLLLIMISSARFS